MGIHASTLNQLKNRKSPENSIISQQQTVTTTNSILIKSQAHHRKISIKYFFFPDHCQNYAITLWRTSGLNKTLKPQNSNNFRIIKLQIRFPKISQKTLKKPTTKFHWQSHFGSCSSNLSNFHFHIDSMLQTASRMCPICWEMLRIFFIQIEWCLSSSFIVEIYNKQEKV